MSEPAFDRSLVPRYGVPERLSPRIERVLAPNPGPFTFKGTGVYLVGAGDRAAVVDPGPDLPDHIAALKRALAGRSLSHILVTHTHRDHSPAAAALKEWSGAKTYAFGPHPSASEGPPPLRARSALAGEVVVAGPRASEDRRGTEESGDRDFIPDVMVRDGDVLQGDGFTLECVYTPGHISNHMCYALKEENALFSGDHVMGWSTTIVAPPDGNMADYMRSLEKLIARPDAVLYPTHGSPITQPGPFLRASLSHRRMRASQIRDSLIQGQGSLDAIVARLYPDIAPELRKAAGLMVRAHLEQMRAEGRTVETGGRWQLSD